MTAPTTTLAERLRAGAGSDPGRQAAVRLLLSLDADTIERMVIRDGAPGVGWILDHEGGGTAALVLWGAISDQYSDALSLPGLSRGEGLVLAIAASLAGWHVSLALGHALAGLDATRRAAVAAAMEHAAGGAS